MKNPIIGAACLLILAFTNSTAGVAADSPDRPVTSDLLTQEEADASPVSDDSVLRTHNMSAERRDELLRLAGITPSTSSPAGSLQPVRSTDDKGVSTSIWETSYARIVEQINEEPKSGDLWLATVTTEAFGQSFTVTSERETGEQVRVSDSRGGWRIEEHDRFGRLTRAADAHGELFFAFYNPGAAEPALVRIGGNLFLVAEKGGDRRRLIATPDGPTYLTWDAEEAHAEPVSTPWASLGFPTTVAQWNDELYPSGRLHVRYQRGNYALSPLDGGELWRVVGDGGITSVQYTDTHIRLVIGFCAGLPMTCSELTWRRGALPVLDQPVLRQP